MERVFYVTSYGDYKITAIVRMRVGCFINFYFVTTFDFVLSNVRIFRIWCNYYVHTKMLNQDQ